MGTRKLLWLQQLIQDILGHRFKGILLCNNEAAIKVGEDDSTNKRTRHTEREFYITNQALLKGKSTLNWVATKDQVANVLTKALAPGKHRLMARQLQKKK